MTSRVKKGDTKSAKRGEERSMTPRVRRGEERSGSRPRLHSCDADDDPRELPVADSADLPRFRTSACVASRASDQACATALKNSVFVFISSIAMVLVRKTFVEVEVV